MNRFLGTSRDRRRLREHWVDSVDAPDDDAWPVRQCGLRSAVGRPIGSRDRRYDPASDGGPNCVPDGGLRSVERQDQALDALRADRLSSLSSHGTRIVIDVAKVDLPGDDSHQKSVVVPFDGEGEPVELACGLGTTIGCAWSWIWSPDDSILIGTVPHETSSTYLQADPDTGQVTVLDWVDVGDPARQRVAT